MGVWVADFILDFRFLPFSIPKANHAIKCSATKYTSYLMIPIYASDFSISVQRKCRHFETTHYRYKKRLGYK